MTLYYVRLAPNAQWQTIPWWQYADVHAALTGWPHHFEGIAILAVDVRRP